MQRTIHATKQLMSHTFPGELYLVHCIFYCIDRLILVFFQCKHNFLGFTVLRIHDYDPELGTPDAQCPLAIYAFLCQCGYATCISRVWFRQGPYIFHSKCQGKDFFRDAVRN